MRVVPVFDSSVDCDERELARDGDFISPRLINGVIAAFIFGVPAVVLVVRWGLS